MPMRIPREKTRPVSSNANAGADPIIAFPKENGPAAEATSRPGELASLMNSDGPGDWLDRLQELETEVLKMEWKRLYRCLPPSGLSRDLLIRAVAFKLQERLHGGLSKTTKKKLLSLAADIGNAGQERAAAISLRAGARLIRDWQGMSH